MITATDKITDDATSRVEEVLQQNGFPTAECYRPRGYNFLLRVRIIDDRFRGLSRVQREELVEPIIQRMPEERQSEITMLVLICEEERRTSLVNLEFENPSQSQH